MRRETDPVEPRGHVSTERAFFQFPSLGWQTCVSPLEMTFCAGGHSKGSLALWVAPDGPEGGSRVFCARSACTHRRIVATTCELAAQILDETPGSQRKTFTEAQILDVPKGF